MQSIMKGKEQIPQMTNAILMALEVEYFFLIYNYFQIKRIFTAVILSVLTFPC